MLAGREDVIECFKVILGREPESEKSIAHHLSGAPSIWDVIRNLINSEEFLGIVQKRSHVSLNKCFDIEYLIRGLPVSNRVRCFLHHHQRLSDMFVSGALQALYFEEQELWSFMGDSNRYSVTARSPVVNLSEGELELLFKINAIPVYSAAMTLISGDAVGFKAEKSVLVSRMQGFAGFFREIRVATKELMEVSPQSVVFSVICGIGEASDAKHLFGVTSERQVCFGVENCDSFYQSYDTFFASIGASGPENGLYRVELPFESKSLSLISSVRRLRTRKKREFKSKIVAASSRRWASLRLTSGDLARES